MEDRDFQLIVCTMCITSIVVIIFVSIWSNYYNSYYKKNLCVETFDKYSDVVKCENTVKKYYASSTVRYFVKIERQKSNEKM